MVGNKTKKVGIRYVRGGGEREKDKYTERDKEIKREEERKRWVIMHYKEGIKKRRQGYSYKCT